MSDLLQEIADVPREFFKDGTQFINRCTKRRCPVPIPLDTHCNMYEETQLTSPLFSHQPTEENS